jgi:hypothetical protein
VSRLWTALVLVLCLIVQQSDVLGQGSPLKDVLGMGGSNIPALGGASCMINNPTVWPTVVEGQTAPTVTITTTNCTAPVACTVTTGSLPTGIIESSECVYSDDPGAAHSAGSTAITITATPAMGSPDTQNYTIVIDAAASALPSGWFSGDIGLIGDTAGTVVYDDNGDAGESLEDIWTLTSSAPNITGTSDNFRYACKTMTGDATMIAEVTSFTGATFAQAGVMFRKDLTSGAPHLFVHTFPIGGGLVNQRKFRLVADGATTNEATGVTAHYWLRVSRVGDVVTGYVSDTGTPGDWIQAVTSQTLDLDDTAYLCMALTNIVTTTVADADFENVSVSAIPPIEPENPDFGGYRTHYQGFGADTPGGRGDASKTICVVTSRLSTQGLPTSSGSDGHYTTTHHHGTFKQCVGHGTAFDPSYIVFDVSGYIELGGEVEIDTRYLTIAGQTAPSPGVALRNGYLVLDNSDIVLQHLRIRCSSTMGNVDGVYISGPDNGPIHNIVLDHVSISWCGHESAGGFGLSPTFAHPQDILVVDSLMGENFHPTDPDPKCFLVFGFINGTLTYARNLHTHCANRSPWISAGQRASVYNNIAYNAKGFVGQDDKYGFVQVVAEGGQYPASLVELAYIGNVNVAGPQSTNIDGTIGVHMDAAQLAAGGADIYLADNTGPGMTSMTQDGQWAGVFFDGTAATRANSECNQACFDNTFTWHHTFNYVILNNADVEDFVYDNVGAWPMARDALDSRLVNDTRDGTGTTYPNSDSATPSTGFNGIPLAESSHTYAIPADPHGAGTCGTTGLQVTRTKIECQLETDARALEPRWSTLDVTSTATMDAGTAGSDYDENLSVTGGNDPYVWSLHDNRHDTATRYVCAAGNSTCGGLPAYTTMTLAITAAACGDTIRAKANETFEGNFTLSDKNSGAYCPITITTTATSGLPDPGERICPTGSGPEVDGDCTANIDPTLLPKFQGTQSSGFQNDPVFKVASSANGWSIKLVEIRPNFNGSGATVRAGQNDTTVQFKRIHQPDNFHADQIYWNLANIHPYWGQRRAIELHGKTMMVTNSLFDGANAPGTDSNTIWICNGSGPTIIRNNWIRGGTEQIFTCGDTPHIKTVARITGGASTTGAALSWASTNTPNGDCPFVGQTIAIGTQTSTMRRHSTVASVSNCTTTSATVTWSPAIAETPDVPGDVRWGMVPGDCHIQPTSPCAWGAEIDYNEVSRDPDWRTNSIIPAPTGLNASALAGSGTLTAGTYTVAVAALATSNGVAVSSAASSTTQVVVAANGRVSWSVTAMHADVTVYRVYLTVSGTTRFTDFSTNSGIVTAPGTTGTAPSTGTNWQLKTLIEFKGGIKYRIRYNRFFNSWNTSSGQGEAIWAKSVNQSPTSANNSTPWMEFTDSIFEYNVFHTVPGMLLVSGNEYETSSNFARTRGTRNFQFKNNLAYDLSNILYGTSGIDAWLLANSCDDCILEHNTVDYTGNSFALEMDGSVSKSLFLNNLTIRNNLLTRRRTNGGFHADGGSEGTVDIESTEGCNCVGQYTITANVFGNNAAGPTESYPSGNTFAADATWRAEFSGTLFTAITDYELDAMSAYRDAGTDGEDLGVIGVTSILDAKIDLTNAGNIDGMASYPLLGGGACFGLRLLEDGSVIGAPLFAGTCSFFARLTDDDGTVNTREFSITVN